MKRPEGRREPRPPRAPARFEAEEAAMMQHAREALRRPRGAAGEGDPFDDVVMHATLRQMLKEVADQHERNAAHMLDLALAGAEDAHEALVDLIAERNVRGEALGPAL